MKLITPFRLLTLLFLLADNSHCTVVAQPATTATKVNTAELIKQFYHKDAAPATKMEIAQTIADLDDKAGREIAIPYLVDFIRDCCYVEDAFMNVTSTILSYGHYSVPFLIQNLKNEKKCSVKSLYILGEIGEDAYSAVPAIIDIINDKNRKERKVALEALGNIGPKAHQAVPYLINILKNEPDVAPDAIIALGKIGPNAKAGVPFMMPYLDTCLLTTGALGNIGPDAKAAIPRLREQMLKISDIFSKHYITVALAQIGDIDYSFSLLKNIFLDNENFRIPIAKIFGTAKLSDKQKSEAIPLLKNCVNWYRCEQKVYCAEALVKIGGPDADLGRTTLYALLKNNYWMCRENAALAIAEVRDKLGGDSLEQLINTLYDNSDYSHLKVISAISKFGPSGKAAIPVLEKFLNHKSPLFRITAEDAIQKIRN